MWHQAQNIHLPVTPLELMCPATYIIFVIITIRIDIITQIHIGKDLYCMCSLVDYRHESSILVGFPRTFCVTLIKTLFDHGGQTWFARPVVSTVLSRSFLGHHTTQCSSLRFGGRWSSPNLKFSKLREIKQYKTVVYHNTTTWSRYLFKFVSR